MKVQHIWCLLSILINLQEYKSIWRIRLSLGHNTFDVRSLVRLQGALQKRDGVYKRYQLLNLLAHYQHMVEEVTANNKVIAKL